MPTTELADEDFSEEGTIDLISMLVKAGMVPTRSEGRRAIEQGGVSIDGEKITDVKYTVAKDALTGEGVVLKKGKKKFNFSFFASAMLRMIIRRSIAAPMIRSIFRSSGIPAEVFSSPTVSAFSF